MAKGKAHETKKPNLWSRMKTWQKVLVILLGLGLLGSIFSSSEEPSTTSNSQSEQQVTEDDNTETESKVETVEEWQDVITVSGSADKKTEPFEITGKRWKVIYTINAQNEYAIFNATATEPGASYGDDIVLFADESGETVMYTSGEFYLDVSSANCSWEVEVQQLVEVEKTVE
jgi:hypothetical protein